MPHVRTQRFKLTSVKTILCFVIPVANLMFRYFASRQFFEAHSARRTHSAQCALLWSGKFVGAAAAAELVLRLGRKRRRMRKKREVFFLLLLLLPFGWASFSSFFLPACSLSHVVLVGRDGENWRAGEACAKENYTNVFRSNRLETDGIISTPTPGDVICVPELQVT